MSSLPPVVRDQVAEIRRRPNRRDWEVRLEPPVNAVVPVSREELAALWLAYGEKGESE